MQIIGQPVCKNKLDTKLQRKHRMSGVAALALMGILLIVCIILSFIIGRYPVPIRALLGIISSKICNITPYWSTAQETAVLNIRLPRVILSVLVGACLSAAGASYQGIFQNPMAAPHILGASAGAGFGAALAINIGCYNSGFSDEPFNRSTCFLDQ